MSKFNLAFPVILKHEGKLVEDPVDPGGITNYGISLRYLKKLVKEKPYLAAEFELGGTPEIDAYDIKNMALSKAEKLYQEEWWNKYQYGKIDNQAIANKIFDCAINIGPKNAAKLLQTACNKLTNQATLAVDGILGNYSFSFINSLNQDQQQKLLKLLSVAAADYYRGLVLKRPTLAKFLKGWLNRAYEV